MWLLEQMSQNAAVVKQFSFTFSSLYEEVSEVTISCYPVTSLLFFGVVFH